MLPVSQKSLLEPRQKYFCWLFSCQCCNQERAGVSDCVRQSAVRKAPSFPSASLAGRKEGNFLTSGQAGEQLGLMMSCKTLPGLAGAGADSPRPAGTKRTPHCCPVPDSCKEVFGGSLREGSWSPKSPANPRRDTRPLSCPALPGVRQRARPQQAFVSGLHGFGKILPIRLSHPLLSEFLRIKPYLLINL